MVYVNYGRVEDFDWLKKSAGIDVRGKICIARYGQIFRADKVSLLRQCMFNNDIVSLTPN